MIKPYEVIPKSEQVRILHEVWDLAGEREPDIADSIADIGAWLLKSMSENSPVRVLTIMSCLGYALDSNGHVVAREDA